MNLLLQQQIDEDDGNDGNNLNNNVISRHGGHGDCRNDRDKQEEEEEEEEEEEQEQEQQQPFDLASNWIHCVNKKERDADYFILRLEDISINEGTVRSIIDKHENANSQALEAILRKKLKVWEKYYPTFIVSTTLYQRQTQGLSKRIGL